MRFNYFTIVWSSYGVLIILNRCSCGDVMKLKDDCQAIKPTILLSVPRLYNKIVESVKGKFEAEGGFKFSFN